MTSLLTGEPPVAPLDRLAREAIQGARTANRGKGPELVDAAIRRALRETVFRFELVMRINVTAHDLLDREFLLEAVFAAQLAMLLSDQRKERLADKSHLHRLAHCRYLTLQRVDELLANQEARSAVEARYLDGHGALFPDVATAFDKQLRVGQAIADMAVRLAELDGVAPAAPEDPQAVQLRAGQIVADLVEPAKADALEKLGEGRQALGVASDWVRMKLAPRAVKGAGPAAAQES